MKPRQLDPRTTRYDQPHPTLDEVSRIIKAEAPDLWGQCADGELLCPGCMLSNKPLILNAVSDGDNDQWRTIGWVAVADGEPDATCAHCYRFMDGRVTEEPPKKKQHPDWACACPTMGHEKGCHFRT